MGETQARNQDMKGGERFEKNITDGKRGNIPNPNGEMKVVFF